MKIGITVSGLDRPMRDAIGTGLRDAVMRQIGRRLNDRTVRSRSGEGSMPLPGDAPTVEGRDRE